MTETCPTQDEYSQPPSSGSGFDDSVRPDSHCAWYQGGCGVDTESVEPSCSSTVWSVWEDCVPIGQVAADSYCGKILRLKRTSVVTLIGQSDSTQWLGSTQDPP